MSDSKPTEPAGQPQLSDTADEARALAREGLDEMHGGNKEEGKFLIDEARSLDKAAADEVVKSDK